MPPMVQDEAQHCSPNTVHYLLKQKMLLLGTAHQCFTKLSKLCFLHCAPFISFLVSTEASFV